MTYSLVNINAKVHSLGAEKTKKSSMGLFLAALLLFSLVVFTADLSGAQTSNQNTTASIGNTNSNDSLQFTHQVVTHMPNGTLCAAFSTNLLGTNNYEVYVTTSNDDGTTWGTPMRVSNAQGMNNSACNQGIYGCAIAADAKNCLFVAWTGVTDGSTYFQVWCTRYNGTAWEIPVQVSQGAAEGVQAFYQSIAVDGNNDAHLVWQAYSHGYNSQRIFYAKYTTAWSSPIVISTQPSSIGSAQMYPDIAVDASNNLHVVWSGGSGTVGQIWYATYSGTWQTPISISSRSDLFSYTMSAPCIAVGADNSLHVVWNGKCDSNPSFDQIWYAKYSGAWNTPIKVSSATNCAGSTQDYPSIAVDSQNILHVAWNNEGEHNIYYANCTTTWSTPIQIENTGTSYPHFRWSYYPRTDLAQTGVDLVFLEGTVIRFQSRLSPSTDLSVSVTPKSGMALPGQPIEFTATVFAGTSPYTYQWYLNNTVIQNATSATWTYTSSSSGTLRVHVRATDALGEVAESSVATVDVRGNNETLLGIFGYPKNSSQAGGSGTQYTASGSRFNLEVGANVTSVSCLMKVDPWLAGSAYCFRYAIYTDNAGATGDLVAQTDLGEVSTKCTAWQTLSFNQSIYLNPGAYWLMAVTNASQYISIYKEVTSDANKIVDNPIGGITFPTTLSSPTYTFGYVTCIYATWGLNFSATVANGDNIFNIDSNSTISYPTFNESSQQLSFNASGASGSVGYTQIFIPKTVLPDITGLSVTIDGQPADYNSTSFGDYWILYIAYHHSTHKLAVTLPSNGNPDPTPTAAPQSSSTQSSNPTSTANSDKSSTPTPKPSEDSGTSTVPELPSVTVALIALLAASTLALFACRKRGTKSQFNEP